MSMKLRLALLAIAAFCDQSLEAQNVSAAGAASTNATTASNSIPALKFKSKTLQKDGIDFGSFVTIKTDAETIGVQLVPRSRIQSENEGKRLIIHLNDESSNRINIEFFSDELAEWSYESTFPLVSRFFAGGSIMRSTASSLGRPSFVYSGTKAGDEVRAQLIKCKTGYIMVSTIALGKNSKEVIFSMQRIVSSFQTAESENKLIVPKPSNES